MVHNLVHNLCESLVTNIGDIVDTGKRTPPVPITYLTQWRMMGNSVVHTDEYLTQWKVEGNSVVDNNAILSCGDLGLDGYYHVKISNGVTIYDIPLTEPLRKVGDVADDITFANGVTTVTRKCDSIDLGTLDWSGYSNNRFQARFELPLRPGPYEVRQILNTGGYTSVGANSISTSATQDKLIAYVTLFIAETGQGFVIRDESFSDAQDAKQKLTGIYAVYELVTPTTEVIQAPQIAVSPTGTYSSDNDTVYSSFTYVEDKQIWSCGEYSAVDSKYHILVQPLGGSIADIALDEPLRKVNDVADSIEFADDVATLTRRLTSIDMGSFGNYARTSVRDYNDKYGITGMTLNGEVYPQAKFPSSNGIRANMITTLWTTSTRNNTYIPKESKAISMSINGTVVLYDEDFNDYNSYSDFQALMQEIHPELIYELANPTTETIQVPQIAKADSYSCVISQGGKAIGWSSFETN